MLLLLLQLLMLLLLMQLLLLYLILGRVLLLELLPRLLMIHWGVSKLLRGRLVVLVVSLYGAILLLVCLNLAALLIIRLEWVVVPVSHAWVCQVMNSWVNVSQLP